MCVALYSRTWSTWDYHIDKNECKRCSLSVTLSLYLSPSLLLSAPFLLEDILPCVVVPWIDVDSILKRGDSLIIVLGDPILVAQQSMSIAEPWSHLGESRIGIEKGQKYETEKNY